MSSGVSEHVQAHKNVGDKTRSGWQQINTPVIRYPVWSPLWYYCVKTIQSFMTPAIVPTFANTVRNGARCLFNSHFITIMFQAICHKRGIHPLSSRSHSVCFLANSASIFGTGEFYNCWPEAVATVTSIHPLCDVSRAICTILREFLLLANANSTLILTMSTINTIQYERPMGNTLWKGHTSWCLLPWHCDLVQLLQQATVREY